MEALLLRVPEVVARLGMSRAKVYELMATGALRSVRVDGCRRVRAEDLVAFVASLEERWPESTAPSPSPSLVRPGGGAARLVNARPAEWARDRRS
jgi:excisionase family DNA binding protein